MYWGNGIRRCFAALQSSSVKPSLMTKSRVEAEADSRPLMKISRPNETLEAALAGMMPPAAPTRIREKTQEAARACTWEQVQDEAAKAADACERA